MQHLWLLLLIVDRAEIGLSANGATRRPRTVELSSAGAAAYSRSEDDMSSQADAFHRGYLAGKQASAQDGDGSVDAPRNPYTAPETKEAWLRGYRVGLSEVRERPTKRYGRRGSWDRPS